MVSQDEPPTLCEMTPRELHRTIVTAFEEADTELSNSDVSGAETPLAGPPLPRRTPG